MFSYQHILVGVDLSSQSQQIIARVNLLFAKTACRVSLCHILEPITLAYGTDIPIDLTEVRSQLQHNAMRALETLAESLQISDSQQLVLIGDPAHEMHHLADELAVDLIVVGTHGRHGLSLLFGSTSTRVLHGTGCDILAVRINPIDDMDQMTT
ncbi:MAG: universal stress protein [Porticoccaceae bacterium]|nr:universal stress protein [Porticoccaceae bacterium]